MPVNCHLKKSPIRGAQAVPLTPDMGIANGAPKAPLKSTILSSLLEKPITEHLP